MPDIDFQKIELNLIPKKGDEPVVFYASQYETARPFIADLFWGDTEFAPGDDCWAEIDIRKNDDNLVVITDDVSIDNNEVSVVLPVQALTCIGKNLGQVKIYASDDQLIAALNFILEVQPDPLAGGVDSETAIDNLTTQIEAIAEEVIGEDYYDKSEVDALLADKANVSDLPDMNNYYTKSDIDGDFYTKNQVDYKLDDYALRSWVASNFVGSTYLYSNYYKKTDVDSMLYNMLPIGSASGNPCSFDTEIAGPLQSLTAEIVASGGGGTPSTPIPIVGHSAFNLDVNGDTFTVSFGQTVYGGVLHIENGRTWLEVTYEINVLNGNSTLVLNGATANTSRFFYYPTPTKSNGEYNIIASNFYISEDNDVVGAMKGRSGNSGIEFSLPPTVAQTHAAANAWFANNPTQLVYELATPIVIDVSSISPSAVVGTNTITSDCIGDVTTTYKDSIQHYIDTRV